MSLTIAEVFPQVSLAGNPIRVKIHTDNLYEGSTRRPFYTIILNVYNSSNTLLRSLSEEPDNAGDAWFSLSSIFSELAPTNLYPVYKTLPIKPDSIAVASFYFKLAEGYGTPYVEQPESTTSDSPYFVIPGGLPSWYIRRMEYNNTNFYQQLLAQSQWLTNQPANKTVYPDQPEMLRIFNMESAEVEYRVKRISTTGEQTTATLWTGQLNSHTLYTFLASPVLCALPNTAKYSVYLTANGEAISNEASFVVENCKPESTRYIIFQNSMGGFDCTPLTGKISTELETYAIDYTIPEITTLRESLTIKQGRATGAQYLIGSVGWKTDSELEWLSEMLLSESRYLVLDEFFTVPITIIADRRPIGDNGFNPKTFSIDAEIDNLDSYFANINKEILVPELCLLDGSAIELASGGQLILTQRL